jgi:hypothetical protein
VRSINTKPEGLRAGNSGVSDSVPNTDSVSANRV